MKTDIQGCSTCPRGEERYEVYHSSAGERVQYDYRTRNGSLFSCVAKTLKDARRKRDAWIVSHAA